MATAQGDTSIDDNNPNSTDRPRGDQQGSIAGFCNIGALIIRIGFGGVLCYDCNKEPPK